MGVETASNADISVVARCGCDVLTGGYCYLSVISFFESPPGDYTDVFLKCLFTIFTN